MPEPKIIKAEPGDAIISTGTGRVLLNVKGILSKLRTSEESGGTTKPTTPERPGSEGIYIGGTEGIVHTRIFVIHSDNTTKVYVLAHELSSVIPAVHIYENKIATHEPGPLIWPGSSNPRGIVVNSIDSGHTEVEFPGTGNGFSFWVVISG
jgi:hypothetical protein